MKKLIALMVSLGLITTMSLTSFAAVTVTPAKGDAITINATETAEDSGVYTFDEATTTFTTTIDEESGVTSENSQTTILAVSGYNGTAASITTNSIQYINQGTEKNFTFALKEGLITDENPNATVTILVGGDNMPEDKPVTVATLTIATVDDEGGEDSGEEETQYNFTVNTGITGNPYGIENAKIIRISDLTAEDVVTLTIGENTYTSKYYTATDGSIIHIIPVVTADEITSTMFSVAEGTPENLEFGAVDTTVGVSATDALLINREVVGASVWGKVYSLPTDITKLIVYDTEGNGAVTATDALLLNRAVVGASVWGKVYSLETMGAYEKK